MKTKVKDLIEKLEKCNPDADLTIVLDGQIPFEKLSISCGYNNYKEGDNPKTCDVVSINIHLEDR